MSIDALLGRSRLEQLALAERVLQRVLDQLSREGALAGYGDLPPEELIGTALGNWLSGMLTGGRSPAAASEGTGGGAPPAPKVDELIERNSDLAAALGACDCWGDQADCPFCDGDGSAGWVRPDRHRFATYVYPALRAVRASGTKASAVRPKPGHHTNGSSRKENAHD